MPVWMESVGVVLMMWMMWVMKRGSGIAACVRRSSSRSVLAEQAADIHGGHVPDCGPAWRRMPRAGGLARGHSLY